MPIIQKKILSGQVGLLGLVLYKQGTLLEKNQNLLTERLPRLSSEQRLKTCLKRRALTSIALSLKFQLEEMLLPPVKNKQKGRTIWPK